MISWMTFLDSFILQEAIRWRYETSAKRDYFRSSTPYIQKADNFIGFMSFFLENVPTLFRVLTICRLLVAGL